MTAMVNWSIRFDHRYEIRFYSSNDKSSLLLDIAIEIKGVVFSCEIFTTVEQEIFASTIFTF